MKRRNDKGGKGKVDENIKADENTDVPIVGDGEAGGTDPVDTGDASVAQSDATGASEDAGAGSVDDSTVGDAAGERPTLAKPQAWRGSSAMDDIDRRQSTRRRIARETKSMSPPVLGDLESLREYAKDFKKKNEEYLDACFLVDYDLDRYKYAFRLACEGIATRDADTSVPFADAVKKVSSMLFALADEEVPLSSNDREKVEQKREAERQEEEKAKPKDPNEVDGQMKLPLKTKVRGDDGSEAEAASDCVTRPLEEGEDVTAPKPDASTDATSVSTSLEADGPDAAQTADPALSNTAENELDQIFAEEALTDEGAKPLSELLDAEAAKVERRKRRLAARRGAQ